MKLYKKINSLVYSLSRTALIGLLYFYKGTLSYLFGPCCRFHPSCSEFSYQCFKKYSLTKAFTLTFLRILKCNPLGPKGFDPVENYENKIFSQNSSKEYT